MAQSNNVKLQEVLDEKKHFISANGVIYTIDDNGNLIQPDIASTPEKDDFLDYGMDSLSEFAITQSSIKFTMKEERSLDGGVEFIKTIKPKELGVLIKRMEVLEL